MQNLRLIPGADEMWDRLKASVWVRFHAFFSIYSLPAILVLGCFLIATFIVRSFFNPTLFFFISFYKISLQPSTATLISLKTSVVGHMTWQRVIHGLFSLQAPGLATRNQALRLCLVRWLIPYQSREEGADEAFSVWTVWLIIAQLSRVVKAVQSWTFSFVEAFRCFAVWFMTYL